MRGETIQGQLATGVGFGKHFTRLDWAREQFMAKLGIDPYPGTVNVIVQAPDQLAIWDRLKEQPGIPIENPNDGPHDCDARCYLVAIAGRIEAAIVLPEVADYARGQVEIIAEVNIREALGIADGDAVSLEIR